MVRVIDKRTKLRLMWLTVAGAVPPLALMSLGILGGADGFPAAFSAASMVLWPTMLQMMAADGSSIANPSFWEVFAVSTACNVIVYVSVGFLLCWIYDLIVDRKQRVH